jgi:predicted  nucleic acid-binding Zn-ribbon protein
MSTQNIHDLLSNVKYYTCVRCCDEGVRDSTAASWSEAVAPHLCSRCFSVFCAHCTRASLKTMPNVGHLLFKDKPWGPEEGRTYCHDCRDAMTGKANTRKLFGTKEERDAVALQEVEDDNSSEEEEEKEEEEDASDSDVEIVEPPKKKARVEKK